MQDLPGKVTLQVCCCLLISLVGDVSESDDWENDSAFMDVDVQAIPNPLMNNIPIQPRHPDKETRRSCLHLLKVGKTSLKQATRSCKAARKPMHIYKEIALAATQTVEVSNNSIYVRDLADRCEHIPLDSISSWITRNLEPLKTWVCDIQAEQEKSQRSSEAVSDPTTAHPVPLKSALDSLMNSAKLAKSRNMIHVGMDEFKAFKAFREDYLATVKGDVLSARGGPEWLEPPCPFSVLALEDLLPFNMVKPRTLTWLPSKLEKGLQISCPQCKLGHLAIKEYHWNRVLALDHFYYVLRPRYVCNCCEKSISSLRPDFLAQLPSWMQVDCC